MGKNNSAAVCRRCLLREMADSGENFHSMRQYIEELGSDIRADGALYEERLGRCKECDMLLSGMCRACGCYVEMRAAVEKNSCPYHKW